jgi:Ca-activated chloride channel family protein
VAAYFADTLRSGELPGNPGLDELGDRAHALAKKTEDKDVRQLAEAIDEANRLK